MFSANGEAVKQASQVHYAVSPSGPAPESSKPMKVYFSPARGSIALALAKAQAEIENVAKNAANPFFKSRYSDLAAIREATTGPLSRNEIAVVQIPTSDLSGKHPVVSIHTCLLHSSGEWIAGDLDVVVTAKLDRNGQITIDAQSEGSAISYGRRYALQAMLGLATEDDDGHAAVHGPPPKNTAETVAEMIQTKSERIVTVEPVDEIPHPLEQHELPVTQQHTQAAPTKALEYPWGKEKGKPLNLVASKSLLFWRGKCIEDMNNPAKAKYAQQAAEKITAIDSELARRPQ